MAAPATVSGTGLAMTGADFCARAQQVVAATEFQATNRVHDNYAAFADSRSDIDPLSTQQYVLFEDDLRTLPIRVSCKMRTPDHLTEEYGNSAAGEAETSCSDLHHSIVEQVYAGLSPHDRTQLRYSPEQIVYELDEKTVLGSSWVAPFDFAFFDANGALHLRAKMQRIDRDDFLWSWAPGRFRGVYNCHVVAPEFLRRLLMGEGGLPTMPDPGPPEPART